MKGFDSAAPVGGIVHKITAAGLGFVGRYYSRNPHKNLSPGEARALSGAGIGIVSVWEGAGDHLDSFSPSAGHDDGIDAVLCARMVEQPQGTVIFFAVDFDASPDDVVQRIVPYFTAVNTALAGHYRVGVYGSGLVCSILKDRNLVSHSWLGGAMGWVGSRALHDWNIKQSVPTSDYGLGFPVDPDETQGDDFGMWMLPAAAPVAIPDARTLQTALATLGLYRGAIDGDWGPLSQAALADYYGR